MAKLAWKCWHEVVELRADLKSGELPLHIFAADLYEVLMKRGKRPVYEDPAEFFALTFPTYNLRKLVRDVVRRVAGKNDKAVRQLELTYGGGKTHTLITLLHLVADPDNLPKLPAVNEFTEAVGLKLPKARVVGLCFDKLDAEKGLEVRSPDGKIRTLKQPWSLLAYQIAGDQGLRLLHADDKPEERKSAPAENLLTQLLEIPVQEGLGILVLLDEVLMYARERAALDDKGYDLIIKFFQSLTQAATKVDRCCIVASLLASDPAKVNVFGQKLQGELYDIFFRQREEVVEPVVKEDVAEVLRRRFFTPKSIKDRDVFRPHVQAALKGIAVIDEQTARMGPDAEERFLKSYPFHPDLTEIFYSKWTAMDRFQRARGVLRTFALALREAVHWDDGPLVGPNVLLSAPDRDGLSEALGELVTVADTQGSDGRRQAWTGILEGELDRAQIIQKESIGLRFREIERAVLSTFLHSQPIGQSARTRDLIVLLGATRPDRIELEKGLARWAQASFWLDDRYAAAEENTLPGTWRLGSRPNLNQMHSVAAGRIPDEIVRSRLLDEIAKVKSLFTGASASGVRVHTLPARPRDIEDDGLFHYAVLGPGAASESGRPSREAQRFLDETTGPEKPRVFRNALLLLAPSKDGLETASSKVRDYLAWEQVRIDLNEQDSGGEVDVARMHTLDMNLGMAKGRIPDAIRQAYCIVVTVSEKNENHAFRINVTDDPHFSIIKNDGRARVQDSSVTAEALLPGGPYDLWREGEISRRVKDLSGAFAQLPHLPKMLLSQAILDTLATGCEQGTFVLRLTRPDGSFRTWWRTLPDETALKDPAIELVLPESARLAEIPPTLLAPEELPELWKSDAVSVQNVLDYFSGSTVVQIQKEGYPEPVAIPGVDAEVVNKAIQAGVENGVLWLVNGPASILAEPIPTGILNDRASLRRPPADIAAAEILPENLPDAWSTESSNALSIASALSQHVGQTLPWATVKNAISSAINARFVTLGEDSRPWPCEYPSAQGVELRVAHGSADENDEGRKQGSKLVVAESDFEPAGIQDLADAIPQLLDIKAQTNIPLTFHVRIEVGDGKEKPMEKTVKAINEILEDLKPGFRLM